MNYSNVSLLYELPTGIQYYEHMPYNLYNANVYIFLNCIRLSTQSDFRRFNCGITMYTKWNCICQPNYWITKKKHICSQKTFVNVVCEIAALFRIFVNMCVLLHTQMVAIQLYLCLWLFISYFCWILLCVLQKLMWTLLL